jgi:hypothetical protein
MKKHKRLLRLMKEDLELAKRTSAAAIDRWHKLAERVRDLEIRWDELQPKFPEPDEASLRSMLLKRDA